MCLYHTAYLEIPDPDIYHGRKNADFGQGFYLTPDLEFARRWAKPMKGSQVFVNCYELNPEGLRIHEFTRDKDWVDYILSNRAVKPDLYPEADIILGPIANDTIFDTMGLLANGFVGREAQEKLFQIGPLYTQLTIKTPAARRALTWLSSELLGEEELAEMAALHRKEEEVYQSQLASAMVEML